MVVNDFMKVYSETKKYLDVSSETSNILDVFSPFPSISATTLLDPVHWLLSVKGTQDYSP